MLNEKDSFHLLYSVLKLVPLENLLLLLTRVHVEYSDVQCYFECIIFLRHTDCLNLLRTSCYVLLNHLLNNV